MGRLPRCVILGTRIRVKLSPEGTEVTGGMHNLGVVFLCNSVNEDLPRQFNLYTRNGRNNSTMMVMIFVSKKRGIYASKSWDCIISYAQDPPGHAHKTSRLDLNTHAPNFQGNRTTTNTNPLHVQEEKRALGISD